MMAFAARFGSLADDLVSSVARLTPQGHPSRFTQLREKVLKELKSHPYLRTNQFEVGQRLDGLEERFRVNNRDGLADALKQRLDALQASPADWHPEILYLLLELSDQPTFNSRLIDLEALHNSLSRYRPPESLQWETVAKEDGWGDDAGLWDTIRYDDSSDDEVSGEMPSRSSETTSEPDPEDENGVGRTAKDLIIHPEDVASLEAIRKAQEWRATKPSTDASGNARKTAVNELHVAREVLFMLQGLETTMFDTKCNPLPSFQTAHIVWDTHRAVMNTFSESGRQLRVLRKFIRGIPEAPHFQAFQDCVSRRLSDFDAKLSEIHARLAAPRDIAVVSLISLRTELGSWIEPLGALAKMISRIGREPDPGAFRYLELLFDETNLAQLSGKDDAYSFLSRIFVECFNVYLRPIRVWMDEGRLIPDDDMFFVYESSRDTELGELWRSRFVLRKTQDGSIHAPGFLYPGATKILNAGKNLIVLARLGHGNTVSQQRGMAQQPLLEYDSICPPGMELAPFSDLFASAFDKWLQSKYRATSATLKDVLFTQCHLPQALEALHHLYLMSDGSAASAFYEQIFERIDTLNPRWSDRSALTAIGYDSFGHLVDSNRLFVSVGVQAQNITAEEARDSALAALPHIEIIYRLPWPIQMVLSPASTSLYQYIYSLLLQFKRAAYVLHQPKVLVNYSTDRDHWDERAPYYLCRSRLLWFCTTIQTYLSTLVLTPNVTKLHRDLEMAQDVDAITAVHDSFVKQIIDEACLGSRLTPIRTSMLEILNLALKLEHQRQRSGDAYGKILAGIKEDFDRHLQFVCTGLRSVARASSDSQAVKWDTLAEMLEA